MSVRIIRKIKNYLLLSKLTPQERRDFETLRQAIIHNTDKITKITNAPSTIASPHQTYILESDIKLFITYHITTTFTSPFQYPQSIPVKHHSLNAYVAWSDGGFTDLSATKRAYLLLKTIRRKAKKHGTHKYGNPVNYEQEFIAKHNTHVR